MTTNDSIFRTFTCWLPLAILLPVVVVGIIGCDDGKGGKDDGDMDILDLGDTQDVVDDEMSDPDLADCPSRPEPGIVCCQDGNRTSPLCEEGMLVCPPGYVWTNEFDCFGEPDVIELDMGTECDSCEFSQVCVHTDLSCGQSASSTGSCQDRPLDCSAEELQPVCGCDGLVYSNPCLARQSGVDIWFDGECSAPAGRFPCGPGFCQEVGEYCELQINMTETPQYRCVAIPDECFLGPEVSCDCLSQEFCAGTGCRQDDAGNFTLECP